ncbi:hypothetical protein [Paeniglutamicibacter kerguelensis]|uniref:Uncharacterized protein n=2 Tax=Paeniglutamicibacter kerguelensis TaxID=254788 RepID=A0ABS4XGR7_9MICC|nr:hypothetical protein [Paeniglutamicibacter kerguelensis]MBP2387650.1 hypothetical protein [Paeniglutamicibacter kerguelensis]
MSIGVSRREAAFAVHRDFGIAGDPDSGITCTQPERVDAVDLGMHAWVSVLAVP